MSPDLHPVRLITFSLNPATVLAQALGFFAEQRLEVSITVTPNSTEQMRGLGAGTWDMASTAFDNVLAWSGREGAEIVAVAQAVEGASLPLYGRPEITGVQGLRGRTLAVDAVDTAYALVLRRILLEHGLDYTKGDYELVPLGNTAARFASMQRGETFAGILNPPFDRRGEAEGMVRLATHADVLPDYPGPVFAVSRAWAQAHEDELLRFLRGQHQALQWLQEPANRREAIERVAERTGETPEQVEADLTKLPAGLDLNRKGLSAVLDLRVRFGMTPPMGPDLSTYVDDTYCRALGLRSP